MLSIIICSRKPEISTSLQENIKQTIGIEYEIIVIDNSNNDYSIYSAYNKGFSLSNYPYLCFVHEDVFLRTENWGANLINHLDIKTTGIVGVAGGVMMTVVPASWPIGKKNIHIVQHKNLRNTKKAVYNKAPKDYNGSKMSALLLDGVFLGMRKDMFDYIRFDETLAGFHGYDIDICAQSTVAGFNNYVVYDILLEHFSQGNGDAHYFSNLMKIYKKWESHLPLYCKDIPENIYANRNEIERKNLAKLIRRLARKKFKIRDIIRTANYYANILNTKEAKKAIRFIYLKIFFEKTVNTHKR